MAQLTIRKQEVRERFAGPSILTHAARAQSHDVSHVEGLVVAYTVHLCFVCLSSDIHTSSHWHVGRFRVFTFPDHVRIRPFHAAHVDIAGGD